MTEFASRYRFPETFEQYFSHGNVHPLRTDTTPIRDIVSSRETALSVFANPRVEGRQNHSILSLIKQAPLEDEAWHEAGFNVNTPDVHASIVAVLLSTTEPRSMTRVLKDWRSKRHSDYEGHFPPGEFAKVYETMQNSLHPAVSAAWLPHIAPLVEPKSYIELADAHFAYSPLPRSLSSTLNARIMVEAEEAVAVCGSHQLFTTVSDMLSNRREYFMQTIYHQRTAIACQRGALAMRAMANAKDILEYQPPNPFARDPTSEEMGITGFLKLIAYDIGRPPLLEEVRHPTPSYAAREAATVLHPAIERILGTFDRINKRSLAHGLANNVVTQLAIRGILDYNIALLRPGDTGLRAHLISLRDKCVVHTDIQTPPPNSGQALATGKNLPPLRLPVE